MTYCTLIATSVVFDTSHGWREAVWPGGLGDNCFVLAEEEREATEMQPVMMEEETDQCFALRCMCLFLFSP